MKVKRHIDMLLEFSTDIENTTLCGIYQIKLSCSCRKFKTFGILCQQGLKTHDVWDIKLIPDGYVLVYIPKVIELFQNEVDKVLPLSIIDHNKSQETYRYVVGVLNGREKYNIMWNPSDQTILQL